MNFAPYSSISGNAISDGLLIFLIAPVAVIALQFELLEFTAVVMFAFALASVIEQIIDLWQVGGVAPPGNVANMAASNSRLLFRESVSSWQVVGAGRHTCGLL